MVTRALMAGFFLSLLLPLANMLRMLSDPAAYSSCFCFVSQLSVQSALIYVASITAVESLLLLLFLIAHHLTKRSMFEVEKVSFQQTATSQFPVQAILATNRTLLFCAIFYMSTAWLILLALIIPTSSQMEIDTSEPLLISIILIVSAVSQSGTPVIAFSVHKQLRATVRQSVTNLLNCCAHQQSETAIESGDNKGVTTLGVVPVDSESRSSSAQRKSLVPAAPTTGPQQPRNSALMLKNDHSGRTTQERIDKLPALRVPQRANSNPQNDRETQQLNLFWQQASKWGSMTPPDVGWGGSANNGKIHQRRESVLVLPKIEPKPIYRRSEGMPSIS
uniref:G-protein coupled receptors family 1 profile domain-containing protein n=1 Tax=Plectus sambesii TaxID=2011161 RepID=A0A914WHP0_9BILA